MRFGPTSVRASSILAKGLRRPKFRSDLRISEQMYNGEKSYVVKVPETNSYNRYGPTEYALLEFCDGSRTRVEIAAAWNEQHPDDPIDEPQVLEFLDGIESEMWEQSPGEKNLAVLERIRDERRSRVDQSSVLYISFKAWDPDKTLAKLDPYLGWMFTPGFVVFSILMFISGAFLIASDWNRVQADTAALYTFQGKTAYDIWIFWVLLLGLGAVHEFGHGLTCKHFGGDVHQMGFLLIYFTPAFFTDTTDIMLFDRLGRRQWVLLAGIWIELVICGISAFIWRFTVPGSFANDFAYKTMLLSGIQGALLNLNPLIKADGYYMLAEYLRIDNLREDSFAYLRAWCRRYLLRQDIELPLASRRQRRVYVIFGVISTIYSTSLIFIGIVFVRNILVSKFGDWWGYLLTAGVIYFFARKGLRANLPKVRAWWREKKEEYMAWKMTRTQQVGALGVALLLLVPPVPTRVVSNFVLGPGREAHVRAQTAGIVRQVFVKQGDPVSSGQLLAILDNSALTAHLQIVADQLSTAESDLRVAQSRADAEKSDLALNEEMRLRQEWTVARENVQGLEIRAPFAGVVSTPAVDQKQGEFLAEGEEFCDVVDRSTMKARILVRDLDLDETPAGSRVQLKVVPLPYRTYAGTIKEVLPAAALDRPVTQPEKLEKMGQELTNYFGVVMVFPNPDGSLTEGMTGNAKIAGHSYPLAWHLGKAAWRWMRSQVW